MPVAVIATLPKVAVDQRRMLKLLLAANPKRVISSGAWVAVVTALKNHADHGNGAITATHARIGAEAARLISRAQPYSHDTVGRVVKILIAAGVLICPPGMEGKSRRATGGAHNQCPTYFVVDPDGVDLRTPPSHVSGTVQVVQTQALYEGPIFPKFANFDPNVVPKTRAECLTAARYLRSRLLAGAVPDWQMAAMMATHFKAGRTPAQVARWACQDPTGAHHRPLPLGVPAQAQALKKSPHRTVARMLLGMIGTRLNQWGDIRPAAPSTRLRTSPTGLIGPRTAPRTRETLAQFKRLGLRVGVLRGQETPCA